MGRTFAVTVLAFAMSGVVACREDARHRGEGEAEAAREQPCPEPTSARDRWESEQRIRAERKPGARAVFSGEGGIRGTLELSQHGDEVVIEGTIRGLSPGLHAIHVHEKGICEGPDFESAGEHFNPTGHAHGAPYDPVHHAGDLGNVTTNREGVAAFAFRSKDLSLSQKDLSILGRSLVIHARPDDMETQPSGDSGSRVACAVIRALPPPEEA